MLNITLFLWFCIHADAEEESFVVCFLSEVLPELWISGRGSFATCNT